MSTWPPAPPGCRYVLRVARRRPLTWSVGLMCRRGRRWVFTRWNVHACVAAHFEYCIRRDRTRNIRVEAVGCEPVEPPTCRGSRQRCEPVLMEELDKRLRAAWRLARDAAEECLEMFGLDLSVTEHGESVENEDKTRCQYDRCEEEYVYVCNSSEKRCVKKRRRPVAW